MTEKIILPPMDSAEKSLSWSEKLLLSTFITMIRPRLIVELGVYQAHTTEFVCRFVELNSIDATVVGFDLPDIIATLRTSNEAVQRYEQQGRLRLIPGRLPESLQAFVTSSPAIDLALVDAVHRYSNVTDELELLWKHLSPDAIVLCHDYHEMFEGIRYAVDRFSKQNDAAMFPLQTSPEARSVDIHSSLVALRRQPHRYSHRVALVFRWQNLKYDLSRNAALRMLRRRLHPLIHR